MLTNTKQRLHTAKWEGNGINGLIYILWGVKFLDLLEREIKPIRKKSEGKEKKPKSRNWYSYRWWKYYTNYHRPFPNKPQTNLKLFKQ